MEWSVAVLKGHIDDSGSDDTNDEFVLGGLLAPSYTWGKLEYDWEKSLIKWNLEYFKASEAHRCEGQFKGWEDSKRDACVGEFLDIALEHRSVPVAASISKDMLKSSVSEFRARIGLPELTVPISPYPFLMIKTVRLMLIGSEALRRVLNIEGRLMCIFDIQHAVGGAVKEIKPALLKAEGVRGIAHVCSKDFVALQAADMWVWSVRRKAEFGKPTRIYSAISEGTGNSYAGIERVSKDEIEKWLRMLEDDNAGAHGRV